MCLDTAEKDRDAVRSKLVTIWVGDLKACCARASALPFASGLSNVGTDDVLRGEKDSAFSLPSNARNSLTNLLIVHPVAAFLTLIQFILSVFAHFQGPAHSPKYLLALLIFCLPTLMVSLLAILVDILIFLPHVEWGGWIVLAATILVALGGIATCGIRRHVVGRIARSKRIQENAEMSGQSHFATQAAARPLSDDDGNKLPEFASFEVNKSGVQPEGERIPLNPRNRMSPQDDSGFQRSNTLRTEGSDRSGYGPPPRGNGPLGPGPNPMGGDGMPMRTQYSNATLQSSSSGSGGHHGMPMPMPMRGPPQGPYGQPERRTPGPGPGPYGQPPPGRFGPSPGPQGGYRGPPQPGAFDPRRGPPGQYGPPGQGQMRQPSPAYGGYGPGPGPGPRGPPMGAIAMGGMRRSPPPQRTQQNQGPQYMEDLPAGIDNNVSDERREFEQTLAPDPSRAIGLAKSDGGYEDDEANNNSTGRLPVVAEGGQGFGGGQENMYIPPRQQQWGGGPAELPTGGRSGPPSRAGSSKSKRQSDGYYEDVAPEFDNQPPLPSTSPHPPALVPGHGHLAPPGAGPWSPPPIPDDLADGQRSPAMSTASGFTSISQRGINPRWQEDQPGSRLGPGRGQVPRQSVGLAGNPDFELPSMRGRGRGRGGALPR